MDYSKINMEKVYMKRHLELAVVAIENNIVTFKVADQFYFGDEFSKQKLKREFEAKNGVIIQLGDKLTWDGYYEILTLNKFKSVSRREETAQCNVHNFSDIMEAINEYNETNGKGKGYEKPWPQKGDEYFYITSLFEVASGKYGDMPTFDKNLFDAGNCIRTREEAEAALERVKKALKGVEE